MGCHSTKEKHIKETNEKIETTIKERRIEDGGTSNGKNAAKLSLNESDR